jgi:MOSC domain-containing protein YiiM
MGGSVLSVNVGALQRAEWSEKQRPTAIDKQPVTGPVKVHADRVGTDAHGYGGHGGLDQAVYAYGSDDAEFWKRELGRDIGYGDFGENLTVTGVPVSGAVSGERWRIGGTILEVTTPRIPCRTFAGFWDIPGLIKRFTAAGRPGAYFRVIQEGEICAGDSIEVLSQPNHGVTVADLLAARAGDRGKTAIIRTLELPAKWQSWQAGLG